MVAVVVVGDIFLCRLDGQNGLCEYEVISGVLPMCMLGVIDTTGNRKGYLAE